MKKLYTVIITLTVICGLALFFIPREKNWLYTEVHLVNCVADGVTLSGPVIRHEDDNVRKVEYSGDGGTGVICKFTAHSPVLVKVVKETSVLSEYTINPGDKITIDAHAK